MAKRKRYDDKFRASAVVMLEAAGYPGKDGALATVAKNIKVPHQTLRRWFHAENNPPPSEIVQEKRGELSDLLRIEIDAALGAMNEARSDASYRDLGTVVGILIDKLQLITGQPTEISEINDVTPVDYSKLSTEQLRQLVAIAEFAGIEERNS